MNTLNATPATTATATLADTLENVGNVFAYNAAAVPADSRQSRVKPAVVVGRAFMMFMIVIL
jgi:hypothetical protein